MINRRALVHLMVALSAVGGLVVVAVTWSLNDVAQWLPDLAVGWAYLLAGLLIGRRPGAEVEGLLVAGVGLTWFAGDVFTWAPLLYRGVLVHAALAMPRGAIGRTSARVVVVVSYVVSSVPLLVEDQLLTLALAAVVGVVAVHAGGIQHEAALMVGGLMGVGAVAHLAAPGADDAALLMVYEVALCAIAAAWAALHPAAVRRRDFADLVVHLGPRDALADLVRVDPAVRDEPAFLAAVEAAERLIAANRRLRDELAGQIGALDASRRRLLSVQDDERARLEERLQHGPVGRLDRIAATLTGATSADPQVAASLASARAQIAATRADLAAISHGLFPSAVADGTLESGLHAIANGSPVPVSVDIQVTHVEPQVAATVYFVCAEAVANAVRHAGAASIAVSVRHVPTSPGGAVPEVLVEIVDDGCGGARMDGGTGLLGLRDRVSILGGDLEVASPAGAGTRVLARIPDIRPAVNAGG